MHLENLINEAIAHLELLAYDLTHIGSIDFSDDLIIEGRICFHRVNKMLDELEQQQNSD